MQTLKKYAERKELLSKKQLDDINSISTPFDETARYNKIFAEMLTERLQAIPDKKTCIMPVNISSAESMAQGQGHVISLGFRKENDTVHVMIYESMPIDDRTRQAQAAIIGQILQAILPANLKIITNGMTCGTQDGADCSLHAVFNSVFNEHACNTTLTFHECSALRAALDNVNQTRNLDQLNNAVTTILTSRNLLQKQAEIKAASVSSSSSSSSVSSHRMLTPLTQADYKNLADSYAQAVESILQVKATPSLQAEALQSLYSTKVSKNVEQSEDLSLAVATAQSLIGDQIDKMQRKIENNKHQLSALKAEINNHNNLLEVTSASLLSNQTANKK